MLYTKNGSIPQEQTDGSDGWVEAPDRPECPDGKEVVWLNLEWVIRDPKPTELHYSTWKWNHSEKQWVHLCLHCKSKLNLSKQDDNIVQ
jgi:hypothetical protein